MHVKSRLLGSLAACLLACSCAPERSFIDPQVGSAAFNDIAGRDKPLRLRTSVEFRSNGTLSPAVDAQLRAAVEQALDKSGIIVAASDGADGEIKVTLNNIADLDGASIQRGNAILTFGAASSFAIDAYEMSVSMNVRGKAVSRSGMRHAIYTTVGNASVPPGAEVVPVSVAFDRVVEAMLFQALQGLLQSGGLPGGGSQAVRPGQSAGAELQPLRAVVPAVRGRAAPAGLAPSERDRQLWGALDCWFDNRLANARACGTGTVGTFTAGLEQDGAALRAAPTEPWNSRQAEGQVSLLKRLKRQSYGRAGFDLM